MSKGPPSNTNKPAKPIGGTEPGNEAGVDDAFELYDLRVEVLDTGKPFVSHAKPGDSFDVIGGRIVFPPGKEPSFSLYAMMAVLPFLPAKQRPTHPNDWMSTDSEIASLDPACGARFRITRLARRTLRHADYSAQPRRRPMGDVT